MTLYFILLTYHYITSFIRNRISLRTFISFFVMFFV